MDAMQIANSLPMWLACGACVALVIIQAVLFSVRSYKTGKKIGISKDKMHRAIKASATTSIGPSIVILSGMLSLLLMVGAPMAWMRLSFIGSVMFESLVAGFGTSAVGVQLGVDTLTNQALAMAVWSMILGSVGWILFSTFAADKMKKIEEKIAGNDPRKIMAISGGAAVGAFSCIVSQKVVLLDKNAISCVLGAAIMALLMYITRDGKHPKLKQWNMTIAIFAATIIAAIL